VAGLLGPNGAGKTTCFYMITGLIPADYGAIYLDGENITAQPMYQRARMGVGYLPQETSIFRGMTVEENVMAVVELREQSRAKAKATVTNLLEELHIEHLRKAPAVSLSGGERRRVEIARALASEPSFMLLDEPFAGIDPLAIADIREVITYLKGRGIGILITDHNVRETLDIIDRASIIHAGEVLFEGSPEEIVHNPEVRRVYLGERFG
jgi:lipopolysaccharide export system ATP-binding protein